MRQTRYHLHNMTKRQMKQTATSTAVISKTISSWKIGDIIMEN